MHKSFAWFVAATLALATPAIAGADRFVVDLAAEPSTLDPQLQWNPDSYYVYRNIFDNLVTRDDKGEIVSADRHGVAQRVRHRGHLHAPAGRDVP